MAACVRPSGVETLVDDPTLTEDVGRREELATLLCSYLRFEPKLSLPKPGARSAVRRRSARACTVCVCAPDPGSVLCSTRPRYLRLRRRPPPGPPTFEDCPYPARPRSLDVVALRIRVSEVVCTVQMRPVATRRLDAAHASRHCVASRQGRCSECDFCLPRQPWEVELGSLATQLEHLRARKGHATNRLVSLLRPVRAGELSLLARLHLARTQLVSTCSQARPARPARTAAQTPRRTPPAGPAPYWRWTAQWRP